MKCELCSGKGWLRGHPLGIQIACPVCVGKGYVEQTNEEWLHTLNTEEKAKVIANATYTSAMMGAEITALPKEDEVRKWEMWLKQPHQGA